MSSMPIPRLKDIKQSISKVSSFLEQLDTQIEERDRLITILNLTPSSNDNLELADHLDRLKKTLNYLQDDLIEYLKANVNNGNHENDKNLDIIISQVIDQLNLYNSYLGNIKDSYIVVQDYRIKVENSLINKPQSQSQLQSQTEPTPTYKNKNKNKITDSLSIKSVRFRDQIESDEESNELRSELMGTKPFKPYKDDESNNEEFETDYDFETASESATLGSINQSNQELFVQHQQQLLDQDENLDTLHNSIKIQRSMGNNINEELNDHLILLNDLEQGVDSSEYRINRATRNLKTFRSKVRENGSLVTIIILTVILILLLVVLN